ncbi:MAG: ABC transporter permease [Candidatus Marinimicrobia bacterium]|nr:ABC transporter permease [Candidatus Neomarinimicrobiota bacterium]
MFNQLYESIIIGFKAVFQSKGRALLTMLGIIIGILSVSLMGTAINGIDNVFNQTLGMFGDDVLYVQQFPWFMGDADWWEFRNRPQIREEYSEKISKRAESISYASVEMNRRVTLSYKENNSEGVDLGGRGWQSAYIDAAKIQCGRYFTQLEDKNASRVILIGSEVHKLLFPNVEDPCGLDIKVNGLKFRVIGVFAEQGKIFGMFSIDNMAVIPFQTLKAVFGRSQWLSISLKIREDVNKDYALEEVRSITRGLRGLRPLEKDNFAINQQGAMEDELGKIKTSIAAVGIGIAALSLLVGGIGIMNIMFVSVKERTKEIGIRKALGAKRWVILIQFLFEAIIIALIGGLIGLGLTSLLVGVVNKFFVASMSLGLVLTSIGVSVGVGIISGIVPASQAARMDPIEAMRYE